MTAPLRELFANTAQDVLNGAINNSVTSLTLNDASEFPTSGNFRIICESEWMLCTARSSNTLTVVRGIEGSTAASHADQSTVAQVLTKDSIDRYGKDNVPLWGENTIPPLNKLVDTDGSTLLTSSDFTWQNQGTASVSDLAGTITITAPATSGVNLRSLLRSTPSAPWTLIAAMRAIAMVDDDGTLSPQFGLVLRESSSSKLITLGFNRQSTQPMRFAVDRWTNDTSAQSTTWKNTKPIFHSNVLWLKIQDNNTNLIYSLGHDGVNWIDVLSESRTAFMSGAPNQFGIMADNQGNSSAKNSLTTLLHWHTE